MSRGRRPRGHRSRRASSRSQIGTVDPRRHRDAPLPDAGCGARSSPTGSASHGAAFDISAACAGYCYGVSLANDMVRGGTADARPGHRRREAVRLHRPARPRHGVHLRRRRRGGRRRPERRPGHRPDGLGLGRLAVGRPSPRRESWARVRDATATSRWPTISDGRARRSSAGPSGAWPRSPSRRIDAAGIKADDLDAFIPHQANMRIIDAMVKQLKLPDRHPVARDIADDGQHLGAPRSRSRPSGCCARGRSPQRRPGPADRLRRRPGLRRAGRRPALSTLPRPDGYLGSAPPQQHHPPTHQGAAPHGTERAGDPRRSRRDRQRGDRSRHRRPSSSTSPSPTTSTSTRSR